MTDSSERSEKIAAGLKKRRRAEKRFRRTGLFSLLGALGFLLLLLGGVFWRGHTAFVQTEIALEVFFDPELVQSEDFSAMARNALAETLGVEQPDRSERRKIGALLSQGAAHELFDMAAEDPTLVGRKTQVSLLASADLDQLIKGHMSRNPEDGGRFDDVQLGWIDSLSEQGKFETGFNANLFSSGDSRQPELAGIKGALVGTLMTLAVTLALSFPIGVGAAVYLEEFAPKNRLTDLIEININNLAAVPSIIFGLLALEIFLNVFGLPRSAPLVGGMTLSLLCLPTIIIASRVSLRAIPPSIRAASLGLGATSLQTIRHHLLPLALPGILTGSIIAMARAMGETAPLLMIGMVAFIVDIPATITDPSSVLPVQIYLWSASPERAFVERTSAAIMVLLGILIILNLAATCLRRKFEKRW